MRPTHNGVLVPDEMLNATATELDAYAAKVKTGNQAFIQAVYAVEDAAQRAGVTLDDS